MRCYWCLQVCYQYLFIGMNRQKHTCFCALTVLCEKKFLFSFKRRFWSTAARTSLILDKTQMQFWTSQLPQFSTAIKSKTPQIFLSQRYAWIRVRNSWFDGFGLIFSCAPHLQTDWRKHERFSAYQDGRILTKMTFLFRGGGGVFLFQDEIWQKSFRNFSRRRSLKVGFYKELLCCLNYTFRGKKKEKKKKKKILAAPTLTGNSNIFQQMSPSA